MSQCARSARSTASKEAMLQMEMELHRAADLDKTTRNRAWRGLLMLADQPAGTPGQATAELLLTAWAVELELQNADFEACKLPTDFAHFVKFIAVDWSQCARSAAKDV